MAYDKKGFYRKNTFAKVIHPNKNFEKEKEKYITSYDTELNVNEKKIESSEVDVEKLYSSGPMKK